VTAGRFPMIGQLPIAPLVRPSNLARLANGRFPATSLVDIKVTGKLHPIAARAFGALQVAGMGAGHLINAVGPTSAFRPFADQERIFLQRYQRGSPTAADRRGREWQGQRWFLKPGFATAAVPGTSNHGWGLAVDVAGTGTKKLPHPRLRWLLGNAATYGFSWELQSETWHIRYVAGDRLPEGVVNLERFLQGAGPTPQPEERPEPAPAAPRILKLTQPHQRGDDVELLQRLLNMSVQDGIFGKDTHQAVIEFQAQVELEPDGKVGPLTWARIHDVLAFLAQPDVEPADSDALAALTPL
jgi:peptidoglycan hydrolase-like protein with peptidoglycan-binding domain